MVNYRRHRLPGGTFFFTVTLKNRHSRMLVQHIDSLREAFRAVRKQYPFDLDAIVILPDHLHTLWTLPAEDGDYATRWRAIKSRFSRTASKQSVPLPRNARGEYLLWQRRYWEHTIRDNADRQRHLDYLHYNPVKHGLVKRVADWPFSSFHRFVRQGLLPRDWANEPIVDDSDAFGE